jgi:hypothetical protein
MGGGVTREFSDDIGQSKQFLENMDISMSESGGVGSCGCI